MEADWHWQILYKIILKKEGLDSESWRVLGTICATRAKRKVK